jgi:hypothetical protein
MVMKERLRLGSPAVKLGAFAVVLGLALAGGLVVGATVGPEPSTGDQASDHDAAHDDTDAVTTGDGPDGLAVSSHGYTLDLRTPVVEPAAGADLALVIEGPDGHPVTDYTVEHDKELHLVIVSRDLASYAHLHPTRHGNGVWTVTTPPLAPGSYRVFADFVPAGGEGLTLGADLTVPGDYGPAALPAPSNETRVDGFDVSFDGELVAGTESELTVTVTRDGQPVTDLQPYLDALGHLVAIRDGDLAYLHVHPLDEADGPGGPQVRFAVKVPTAGTFGLYFDFVHGDEVHTAATIGVATAVGATPPDDAHTSSGEDDSHGATRDE